MYTKYYGFNEKPFTLTPNPRFIYLSKNHKEAFANLIYGINNHYGFIELTGEVGTGKTTILRTLLGQLSEDTYRAALILNPCLTVMELLRSINKEFGLNSDTEYTSELLDELNRFLLAENKRGITVVLVIDEAQNLSPEILEQLRLISNLETEDDKLIQIVLAGQPELATLLDLPELRQLNQRISVRYNLKAISIGETHAYIRHRMLASGETGGASFTNSAVILIHIYSGGLPRLINTICDRALLIGYGDERRQITAGIVIRGIKELINKSQSKRLYLTFTGLVSIVIIFIALSLTLNKWMPNNGRSNTYSEVTPPVLNASVHVAAQTSKKELAVATLKNMDQHILELQNEILSYDQNEMHLLAFNTIANLWGVRQIIQPIRYLTIPKMYSKLAAKRNLRVTVVKGNLDYVIKFGLPFLVLTKVNGKMGGYCMAVTSTKNDSLAISPRLFGNSTISKNDVSSISTGTFYLVWQNFGQIPTKLKRGDMKYEIRALQMLLRKTGIYNETINGTYNAATIKAVNDLQRSFGIPRDENLGELTLAVLTKYYTNKKVPLITAVGNL